MPILEANTDITSEKYIVDRINGYIYDIKVVSKNKPYVTASLFSNNIIANNYKLYKSDLSKELSVNDKISTNDVLLLDGKYYVLSVLGDCSGDGIFDIGDSVVSLRYASGLPNSGRKNIYACDTSKNYVIDSMDSSVIRRNLVLLDTNLFGGE